MATSDLDLALRLKTEGFEAGKQSLDNLGQAAGAVGAASDRAGAGVGGLADATGEAGASAQDATESVGALGRGVGALVATVAAAAAGLTLGAVFGAIVDEANALERQLMRTEAMVRATGEAAGFSAEQLHEQARQLAFATLESTRGIMEAQQVMQSFRSVTGDTFTRAIELATDMSSLFGGSLTSSVTQLGKALEDPVEGLGALRRVGVSFTESQMALVESMVAAGDAAGAQSLILDTLAAQMGGVARAEAMGYAGALDTLSQRSEELRLTLASVFDVLGRAGAVVAGAAAGIAVFTEALQSGRLDLAVDLINLAVDGLGAALSAVITLLGLTGSAIITLIDVAGIIPTPLYVAAAAAVLLTTQFGALAAAVVALGGAITTLVLGVLSRSILIWGQVAAAVGTLTTALKALWVMMLANPLTALLAVLGAAAAAFFAFRQSAEETLAVLTEQRDAIADQVESVDALVAAMSAAGPGTDAYNDAARELATIVPGLSLSLSNQGTLIAGLGEGYGQNAVKLAEWRAEQERATEALNAQELALAAQTWRETSEELNTHTQRMRENYGATEESRNGWQRLAVAMGTWTGEIDRANARSAALNTELAAQGARFRELALSAFDSTGSLDGVAQALRDVGASKAVVESVTEELGRMLMGANEALDGLTDAERRAAEAGIAAARALSDTISVVDADVARLDERIKTHHKDLQAALKAEGESWKALGEVARSTYDGAIDAAERYAQSRRDALAGSTASEAEIARQSTAIAREAAQAKLAALQGYQRESLRLLDEEGRRRVEAARASGGDVRAAELEILQIKRDTLRQIESDYRSHIDALNAESRRHLENVKAIEDEIRQLKMSTEDRIRELQRGAMSEVDAYHDARRQAAEKAAEAERAIVEGNFELAEQLAKQAADLYARNASAIKDGSGQEIISQQRATADAIRGVGDAAEIQARAMEARAAAQQDQADAVATSAQEAEQALASVASEAERASDAFDREVTLRLSIDRAAVDEQLALIAPLVEEREYLLQMRADMDTVRTALADVRSYAADNPVPIELTLGAADALITDLKDRFAALGQDRPELTLKTDAALSAIDRVKERIKSIRGEDVTLTIKPNDSQVQATLNRLKQGTQSTHTIYVRQVKTNATGGPVQAFAVGGSVYRAPSWSVVPGTGNTDSVPAGLRPGSFVLRKSATRYYGDLLRRFASGGLVPSLLMPGERLFGPETVGRWGQGLFAALNNMAIPREQLAAALGGLTAPVARYAAGGLVPGTLGTSVAATTASRDVVDINLRLGARDVRLSGARDQAAALATALRELARGG